MKRYIFRGFLIGVILGLLWWIFGKYIQDTWVLKFSCFISQPVAIIISKISGWLIAQESGIVVYIFAILVTLPLLGCIFGA